MTNRNERPISGVIDYPFPLNDDFLARLRLPLMLTKDDAERIKAFIDVLVIEETPTSADEVSGK